MGTTTGLLLVQRLSQALGGYYSLVADSGSGSSAITDAALANITEDNDQLDSNWIGVTSGNADADIRRLKRSGGYTASTTILDPIQDFSGAVANTDTYDLHRYDPELLRTALNQALRGLYPHGRFKGLYRRLINYDLAVNDVLTNSNFQTFSTGFTGWTEVGSPTVTPETSIKMLGVQSAKIVAGGSDGQLTQAPTINVNEVTQQVATAEFWVYTTAATTARIRLDWGGSSFENSDYHTGADEWQLLRVSANVPDSATQVKVICEVIANGTGRFDHGYLNVGPRVVRYTIPTAIRGGPNFVSMQDDQHNPVGDYFPLDETRITGRRLKLEGSGVLSQPATNSATTEVDGEQVELVVAEAARIFWMTRQGDPDAAGEIAKWAAEADRLRSDVGMRAMPAEMPRFWHTEESEGTRELVLD